MAQSKEFGEKLLKATPYGTRVEGTEVVMTIGPKAVRMDYVTALRLSAFLRHSGRAAKRAAGNHGQLWTTHADLTDANADELEAQATRDGTAIYRGNRH